MGDNKSLNNIGGIAAAIFIALAMLGAGPAIAQGHGGSGSEDEGEGPLFISMDPFIVSVFDRGADRGRLSFSIVLDVADRANSATVRGRLPRTEDSFLNILNTYLQTRAAITGPPDLDEILGKFQTLADETFGEHVVAVLVSSAMRTT